MGMLVHVGATVICTHAGQATPMTPQPRVRVGGQKVVTQSCVYTVTGCALAGTSSPPCATAKWVTAALRVRAGSEPVLLRESQSICTPTGTPLTVLVTQIRVKGI